MQLAKGDLYIIRQKAEESFFFFLSFFLSLPFFSPKKIRMKKKKMSILFCLYGVWTFILSSPFQISRQWVLVVVAFPKYLYVDTRYLYIYWVQADELRER